MGAMNRVRLDVDFGTGMIRDALVYEVAIQDISVVFSCMCLAISLPGSIFSKATAGPKA